MNNLDVGFRRLTLVVSCVIGALASGLFIYVVTSDAVTVYWGRVLAAAAAIFLAAAALVWAIFFTSRWVIAGFRTRG